MRLTVAPLAALALALPLTSTAQPLQLHSAVLRVPGKQIEVIGLRRWSVAMLQDSLAKYAPGETLDSHACAANLRYRLHFADAAATTYTGFVPGDTLQRVIVTVVEPQDSARVRYRRMPLDTTTPYRPWAARIELAQRRPHIFLAALNTYLDWRRGAPTKLGRYVAPSDTVAVRETWEFFAAHATPADYQVARKLLTGSRDVRTRVVAVGVMLNFVDRDEAVRTLFATMLENESRAKDVAGAALQSFAQTTPRPVVWRPAAPLVRAALDGTSLFELHQIMRLLVRTGASPRDARPFLRGGGQMLLAYLGAEFPPLKTDAHALLVALRGEDLGAAPEPWATWIASL